MGKIAAARAYANNEVAYVAWSLDGKIDGCLGFELTRMYPDRGKETVLPAWVPFEGQSNAAWKPLTTSMWPVQKLVWRDLTARKRRDSLSLHATGERLRYRVRALVAARPGLTPAPAPKGPAAVNPVAMCYLDAGVETNDIRLTAERGSVHTTFTNGILAAQWLTHALEGLGQKPSPQVLQKHFADPKDALRKYLAGDVVTTLSELLTRAAAEDGAHVHLALYELSDPQLRDLLVAHAPRVRLILANSAADDEKRWDAGNAPFRAALKAAPGLELHDRMFNNQHIGHNKFAVLVDAAGQAQAVMTGSTNWTPTGLCGQSNNAVLIESPELAAGYLEYWNRLLKDNTLFQTPAPMSAGSSNVQGRELRRADAAGSAPVTLADGTRVTTWYSPNTMAVSKGSVTPPDLKDVFARMERARDAIFFAVFLPSQSGKGSVVEKAVSLGQARPRLLVYGAVSDPTAMPNYVPGQKGATGAAALPSKPATYDQGRVHVVRASALSKDDLVGAFEAELLKAGHAIIHDKIVIVDPLSPDCMVVLGSHNLGFKASYVNDENLMILEGNPGLAQAYMVHVLDLWEHYRFRAVTQELKAAGKKPWDGFLSRDSSWLDWALGGDRDALCRYLATAVVPVPALAH